MDSCKITFLPSGITYEASPKMTILMAAIDAGLYIDAPCGGQGICGGCGVHVVTDGREEFVLACQTTVRDGMVVKLSAAEGHEILETGIESKYDVRSVIKRDATGAVYFDDTRLGVSDSKKPICAIAFDIGTTTVVGYLLDLETGETISTVSLLNPQSKFGADVVSRANYAIQNGGEVLAGTIRNALSELVEEAVNEAGIAKEQIYLVTVVGNTCMHHLFLGISTKTLVLAPYKPAVVEPQRLRAVDYGIDVNENAQLLVLPNISGFVGADTVGAILSSNLDREEPMTLLIDIGTNGEMVLGNRHRLCACSTAAGPAFEGARISIGMRGAKGAIDHADFTGGVVNFSVIGDVKPIGICGSGLIDVIAELVKYGVVDETGKIAKPEELTDETARKLSKHIGEKDGLKVFWLTDDLCLTQKDVREVQLAKAAIASGIELLMRRFGIGVDGVDRVMLAGAFGNYMSPQSACGIGLIPKQLKDKIIPIGNAAGQGAKMVALSKDEYLRSNEIGRRTEYMELAGMPEFNDVFMDKMEF
ncbi:MAG TPA: DUF4445 domain-containing protein [Clostridiales bacterium]|jgi:uncharacterized 2Fe-2S/4Fe-4S cluster protein (DUF4445 family)|nr:DUF4445 domain-containing protein [Clostridiales bacterium]